MIVDAHVHLMGSASISDVETFIKRAKVDKLFLFSRSPIGRGDEARLFIEELAGLAEKLDQIMPFAWIDPLFEDAPELARWAVRELGFRGLKLIPDGWYPEDERARAVYEVAADSSVPIVFHSGILWHEGDCSRYCRPVNFECLWQHPQVRFALAHIGWPWTDECIATVQKMNVMGGEVDQAFVDITPGTPPCYRPDALSKCFAVVGADHMLYGSDAGIPSGSVPEGSWESDRQLLTELGASKEQIANILGGNAMKFTTGK